MEDVEAAFNHDVPKLLQREVAERKGIKWYLALKASMFKATDPSIETDPPAVFNTDAVLGLIGLNYDEDLKSAFGNVMQQLD